MQAQKRELKVICFYSRSIGMRETSPKEGIERHVRVSRKLRHLMSSPKEGIERKLIALR